MSAKLIFHSNLYGLSYVVEVVEHILMGLSLATPMPKMSLSNELSGMLYDFETSIGYASITN